MVTTQSQGPVLKEDVEDHRILRPWMSDFKSWAKRVFVEADSDRSGHVTTDELPILLRGLGVCAAATGAEGDVSEQ